jgi:hypothetical protein
VLDFAGNWAIGGVANVTYHGYSDDGEIVLDGTETFTHLLSPATYAASLAVSGKHTGSLSASGPFFAEPPASNGSVVSVLDGYELTGYPPFGACPTALPAVAALSVVANVVAVSATSASLDVAVNADIRGDVRPVRDAVVQSASAAARTDLSGHATIVVPRGTALVVRATAGNTFSPGTVTMGPI